jgi:hypothetical protein
MPASSFHRYAGGHRDPACVVIPSSPVILARTICGFAFLCVIPRLDRGIQNGIDVIRLVWMPARGPA